MGHRGGGGGEFLLRGRRARSRRFLGGGEAFPAKRRQFAHRLARHRFGIGESGGKPARQVAGHGMGPGVALERGEAVGEIGKAGSGRRRTVFKRFQTRGSLA